MKTKGLLLLGGLILGIAQPAQLLLAAEATPADISNPAPGSEPVEAEAKQLKFDIWEFRITGNTVLYHTLAERSVYRFLGPDRTIEDIDAASAALQTLYKDNGYPTVLVNIPQQDISSGIVKLDVIQGKIDRLKITGSRYFSLADIRSRVPALAVGEVPHLPTVQDQLQALNAFNTDLSVTPIFRPGKTPGTVSVELRVKDASPLHGSLEVNGRNSIGTTRTRLVANLSYNNLWLKSHSLSLTYQTSPEDTDEVQVLVGSYVFPFNETRDRLALYAVKSDSETGVAAGGDISVVGKGVSAGGRWVKSLQGEQRYLHSIVFGFDYKDFDEVVALAGTGDDVVTPINYTLFSMQYNATSLALNGTTTFTAGVRVAPRAFGNNEFEFENKRFEANPNFSILEALITEEYWFENGIKLRGTLAGQYANEPLVSNEQYSIGGADTVRGYYESQILADDALLASFEIQSPQIGFFKTKGFQQAHVKAFVDGGMTRIYAPLSGVDAREEVAGTGVGLRLAKNRNFYMAVDVASPLKDNKIVEKGDIRVHFTVRGGF